MRLAAGIGIRAVYALYVSTVITIIVIAVIDIGARRMLFLYATIVR